MMFETTSAGLDEALRLAHRMDRPIFVLGGGTNVLVNDSGWPGIVLKLSVSKGEEFSTTVDHHAPSPHQIVRVAAATSWDRFVAFCAAQGLQGVECLSGIPGTVGAAPVQNIGAYRQQVSDVIEWVLAVDLRHGRVVIHSRESCEFGYRASLFNRPENHDRYCITAVALRLRRGGAPCVAHPEIAALVGPDPSVQDVRASVLHVRGRKGMLLSEGLRSAGSFFKNPIMGGARFEQRFRDHASDEGQGRWWWPIGEDVGISAAWLIEHVGYAKGHQKGRVGLSPHHALSLINRGNASAADLVALAVEIQERVVQSFGILLEPEVRLVGFKKNPLLA